MTVIPGIAGIKTLRNIPFPFQRKRLGANGSLPQIFSGDIGRAVGRAIMCSPMLFEVPSQGRLFLFVECAKRLLRRTVIQSEMLNDFRGRERKHPAYALTPNIRF